MHKKDYASSFRSVLEPTSEGVRVPKWRQSDAMGAANTARNQPKTGVPKRIEKVAEKVSLGIRGVLLNI